MEIDVGAHISELLYEHDTVIIPGLGGFVSRYKPATADQVQGELHPPSRAISFNGNLVVDDGLLAGHIQEQHGTSQQEARDILEDYVKQVTAAIDRREIVVFPKVGRLYKDYEKKLQFLPDATNFNIDAYGLPTVHFYPIGRTARSRQGPQTVINKDAKPAVRPQPRASKPAFNRSLAILIGIAGIALIAIIYFVFFYKPITPGEEDPQRVPTARVNVSPSSGPREDTLNADSLTGEDEDLLEDSRPGEASPDEMDTEGATAAPDQQYFIIAIGVFGNDENVQRLIKRLYEEGYEPYTENMGKLTRVGVQQAYSEEAELQETLREVRRKFSKDAKVLKR